MISGVFGLSSCFLSALEPAAAEALRTAGRVRGFRVGEVLFREGDHTRDVLLLTGGQVKVWSAAPNGREAIFGIYGPGDLLGEMAGLGNSSRSATATALSEAAGRSLSGAEFDTFLRTYPSAALAVNQMIAGRLRKANQRNVEFAAYSVQTRLAVLIVELADRFGQADPGGCRVRVPLSQQDLAALVGSVPDTVARALRGLVVAGLLETGRRQLTVVDLDRLRVMASGVE